MSRWSPVGGGHSGWGRRHVGKNCRAVNTSAVHFGAENGTVNGGTMGCVPWSRRVLASHSVGGGIICNFFAHERTARSSPLSSSVSSICSGGGQPRFLKRSSQANIFATESTAATSIDGKPDVVAGPYWYRPGLHHEPGFNWRNPNKPPPIGSLFSYLGLTAMAGRTSSCSTCICTRRFGTKMKGAGGVWPKYFVFSV